jgi:hypothetical protein
MALKYKPTEAASCALAADLIAATCHCISDNRSIQVSVREQHARGLWPRLPDIEQTIAAVMRLWMVLLVFFTPMRASVA